MSEKFDGAYNFAKVRPFVPGDMEGAANTPWIAKRNLDKEAFSGENVVLSSTYKGGAGSDGASHSPFPRAPVSESEGSVAEASVEKERSLVALAESDYRDTTGPDTPFDTPS